MPVASAVRSDHHAGCGRRSLLRDHLEKGALTYGVAATFSPFEYQKDGKLTGSTST